MVSYKDFLERTPWNDLVVQRALAELDLEVLGTALAGLPGEIQAIFYRTMSRRAHTLVAEQVSARKTAQPSRIRAAQELLSELLDKHAKAAAGDLPPAAEPLPAIALDSPESILSTFCALAAYARKHGVLPLERLEVSHPLLRMGIELLVDGSDPILMRSILERYEQTLLRQAKTALDMIVDGIDALAERNLPQLVELKLRAHVGQEGRAG